LVTGPYQSATPAQKGAAIGHEIIHREAEKAGGREAYLNEDIAYKLMTDLLEGTKHFMYDKTKDVVNLPEVSAIFDSYVKGTVNQLDHARLVKSAWDTRKITRAAEEEARKMHMRTMQEYKTTWGAR
jgi:hypothetical protein